ncbi:MAG: immune inhibitor A [Chloroflexota bacterium]|nr:immune inhibitor A [Chloroflexota bacterium]
MKTRKLLAIGMVLTILMSLVGVAPVAAQGPVVPKPIDLGAKIRKGNYDLGEAPAMPAMGRLPDSMDYVPGDVVTWLALDDYEDYYYFKDYELKAVGTYGEVWVATDLSWPEGDPREDPVVLQEQIDHLLNEFDTNIYPTDTEFFGTPDEHDGSNSLLVEWGYFPEGYYDGDKVAIMIDNVRDDNYYDSSYPFYIAGFYSPSYEVYFDRNMFTIDAYDWANRIGPDDSPWRGPDPDRWRPYLYEGVFAHEFQHLIHDDNDSDEETWLNEGMSMFAEWLCGYVESEDQFDFFLDHAENSLVMWGDQEEGEPEILADYGIVYLWTLYLYEHFGGGPFVQALATSEANGIASVNEELAAFGYDATFADAFHDFRIACLIDSPRAFKLPFFPWGMFGRGGDWVHPYEFKNADVHVNVDTEEAYSEAGAPPWGTDYIKITDEALLKMIKFNGDDEAIFGTPWTSDGDVLWSGTGDLLDHWAIFEATGGGTLTFDTLWDLEDYWDFGFVQVSTDGGATWTSLEDNEGYSTYEYDPNAHPKVVENLPGLTSWVDEWLTLSYDLSAYAGQDILIGFRLVTDWATHYGGWWIDNVYVDGTLISDGSNLDPFMDITELQPIELDFSVTLVGMYEQYGKMNYVVRDMYLDDLTEEGAGFLSGIVRLGGHAVMLVSLEVPEESAYFYGPYDYVIEFPWE